MESSDSTDLGSATIEPDGEVVAGSLGSWRLTYTVGREGIGAGGKIKIDTDSDTDWGIPQFDDPSGAEYMTVEAPAEALVSLILPNARDAVLAVGGRGLSAGDRVTVTYGDTSGGGPGTRAQTFLEGQRYFSVSVDVDGSGQYHQVPEPPCIVAL